LLALVFGVGRVGDEAQKDDDAGYPERSEELENGFEHDF
jgi:hypothetical protein